MDFIATMKNLQAPYNITFKGDEEFYKKINNFSPLYR
jgi:hypothetical protein